MTFYRKISDSRPNRRANWPNFCPNLNRLFGRCPASTLRYMHPVTSAGPLTGRADELALLDGYLRDLTRGNGATVLIEGEPGIGKTTLVRTALAATPTGSHQVFWGTGDELSQEIPLSPFLDALAVRRPSHNARRATIAGLLRGEVATDRGADVPKMLTEQLIALTIDESDARPVVLVIDDLQWADPHSIKLWGRLARTAQQVPLLLIGLTRPAAQREDLVTLRRTVDAGARVQLNALTQSDVAELVKTLAGGQPDKGLLRLARGAAGNPLYLTELLAALNRSGGIVVTATGAARLTTDSVPDSLAAAIADRLDFVSTPTREVLRAAALLGVEFVVPDLTIVLGKAVTEVMPALDEARATGVLTDSGNGATLAFRHPLLRDALYAELSAPVRSAWHLEAGHALAAAGAAPDRVARQLLPALAATAGESIRPELPPAGTGGSLTHAAAVQSARQPANRRTPAIQLERPPMDAGAIRSGGLIDEWMLDWLTTSAESLIGQAPGVASELLRQAVASIPAGTLQHGWLTSRLADALYRTGDKPEAARVAERALAYATAPDLVVDLHWTLAQVRLVTGAGEASLTALKSALDTPGITPKHRARLLVLAARTSLSLADFSVANTEARDALASAEVAGDIWSTGWALHVLAIMATIRGDLADVLPLYDRALAVTETDPALTDLGILLQINKAITLGNLNRYGEALTAAEQARQLADRIGTSIRLAQAHGLLGQAEFEIGQWDDALSEISAVPDNLKEYAAICIDSGIAAKISFHRNEPEAALRYLAAAEPHADQIEQLPVPYLVLAQSLERERAGSLPEALAIVIAPFETSPEDIGDNEDLLIDAVRLAVKVGDKKTAQEITTLAMQLAEGSEIPSRQANALYCKGMVDRDAVILLAAAQRFVDSGKKLPQAKAFEAAAQCLVEAEDMTKAKQALEQAMEIYEFLDAEADINRLHAEFRQYGIRRGNHRQHRRAVSGWESLTETELKVVALVQEGLSNPEIAARLFTSKRTVGTHVSHILKKLSLTTRTDIARESAKRSIAGQDSAGEEASVGVGAGVG
jgi:DNA-binding CsgD family transcriptional regulator/tetratricopeptide (TPR) repeat protein